MLKPTQSVFQKRGWPFVLQPSASRTQSSWLSWQVVLRQKANAVLGATAPSSTAPTAKKKDARMDNEGGSRVTAAVKMSTPEHALAESAARLGCPASSGVSELTTDN